MTVSKEDRDVLSMPYKKHGPGGYLPVIASAYPSETADPVQNKAKSEKKVAPIQPTAVEKPNPVHVLAKCTWIAFIHATIELVMFYWGMTGLMDYPTSWGASVVVAVIGGFRIGFTLKQNY